MTSHSHFHANTAGQTGLLPFPAACRLSLAQLALSLSLSLAQLGLPGKSAQQADTPLWIMLIHDARRPPSDVCSRTVSGFNCTNDVCTLIFGELCQRYTLGMHEADGIC